MRDRNLLGNLPLEASLWVLHLVDRLSPREPQMLCICLTNPHLVGPPAGFLLNWVNERKRRS